MSEPVRSIVFMSRVFLAESNAEQGDDSKFVFAIFASNRTQAEKIAAEHNASVLALHDGDSSYEVINSPDTASSLLDRSEVIKALDTVSKGARVLLEAALRQPEFVLSTWCPSIRGEQDVPFLVLSHSDMRKVAASWGGDEVSFSVR